MKSHPIAHRSRRSLVAIGVFAVASLSTACGDAAYGGSGMGATPGGLQDMRLARELVEEGMVPPPEAFVVEGMFSEHDLGLSGPACQETFCLRGAGGVAPNLDSEVAGYVQVGMSSNVNPETYTRPSVVTIACVDISGSMGWDYRGWLGDEHSAEPVTPGEMSRALLQRIADELGPDDELAIVTYGAAVSTPLGLTRGDDGEAIHAAIESLTQNGSTNMEAGLETAFALARTARGHADEVRILLFTDVQPNVGATSETVFQRMVREGAEDGVHLTTFAMGLGVGQELLTAIAPLRGANAFGVMEAADIDRLMEEEWPFFLKPIAFDLSLSFSTGGDVSVAKAYGFPGQSSGEVSSLEVASVFLSRRRGALLVELDGLDPEIGFETSIALSYVGEDGSTRIEKALEVRHDAQGVDERGQSFAQPAVAKTAALALLVEGMRAAADLYQAEDIAAAVERMTAVHDRIVADAAALGDADLDAEVALAASLLALMEQGASQGDLYGRY